jgi:hypothetical protein
MILKELDAENPLHAIKIIGLLPVGSTPEVDKPLSSPTRITKVLLATAKKHKSWRGLMELS